MTRTQRLWRLRARRAALRRLLRRAEAEMAIERTQTALQHYDGWAREWLLGP